jgi:hypothetical protein
MSDYLEIVLDGDAEIMRGFFVGYLSGAGVQSDVFICQDFHVQHDSLAREVGEWLGLVRDRTHVIVPASVGDQIREGIDRAGPELKLSVHSWRAIREAEFEFSWKVFNRDEARRLLELVERKPGAVALEDYEPEEIVHEGEEGATGGYAPVHPYEASAKGTARGAPGPVIAWASALREDEFVELGEIRLHYADE